MASRIINSPGVQINEIDETAIQANIFGTDVFVTGFANKGPTDEVISISSLPEFEQIYGTPTNAAERYFYYSVRPLIGTGANILVNRLPYGAGTGDGFGSQFSAVVFPVVAVSGNPTTIAGTTTAASAISGDGGVIGTLNSSAVDAYVLGKPKHFTLSKAQYLSCINGEAFTWTTNVFSNTALSAVASIDSIADFGKAGVIIFNDAQTTINDKYEGYYIGLIDNSNANPATDFDGIITAQTVNTTATSTGSADALTTIPLARLNFALSGASASNGTLSQALENAASFNIGTNQFNDYVTLGVFKLRQSIYAPETTMLDYVLEERYASSVDYYRQRTPENGGPIVSAYLGTEVENKSRNIKIMVNDYVSNRTSSTWLNANGIPSKSIRLATNELAAQLGTLATFAQVSGTIGINNGAYTAATDALNTNFSGTADVLMAVGAYVDPTPNNKVIGSIPIKVTRALQLVENEELFDIDVTVEAGLGTIHATLCAAGVSYYDDTLMNNGLTTALGYLQTTLNYTAPTDDKKDLRGNYNSVFSLFTDFAQDRMDHIFIADPIRHILVTGNNTKTLSDTNKSWSQHVFSPLRHQFELANTSYAAAYANWARVNDGFSQTNVWVPFSGIVAADYARSDRNFAYWSAPAGFTRGLVQNVDDVAITPNQKQRDDLYKFNLNPIAQFVREGIVIYGQKTMQRMPSAFDRVNVRRLFIILEKQTKAIARYYVFEPNTLYTRTRLIDDLTPLFDAAKASTINQGVYDYLIICDDRNNTPAVIDANELVVDIYIKPVRTAEFILVNFRATRTGANFQEIAR
jgi:hypothetical protein